MRSSNMDQRARILVKNILSDTPSGFCIRVVVFLALLGLLLIGGRPTEAAVKKDEYPIATVSADQISPAIDGNIVVWEDKRDGLSGIYGKNLSTGVEFLVSSGVSVKRKPVTNGKVVVWEDNRNGDSDIYGYRIPADLSTSGQEFVISAGPGDQRKPAIGGNRVVWEDKRSGKWEIYSYDLSAGQESLVASGDDGNKTNPAISGNTIVWQDDRNIVGNSEVHVKDLSTGKRHSVSTSGNFADTPAISGSIVVWRQENVGNYDIFGRDLYAIDLETGRVFQVTTDTSDQVSPSISGNVVVWEDHRGGSSNIYAKDLSTGEEVQITTGSAPKATPQINGETVVWESQRVGDTNYGTYDIYGANLDAAPAIPTGAQATGSNTGVDLKWNANPENDVTGYNVYRSDTADGTYVKLNTAILSGTTYSDTEAPKGSVSFYRIKASDAVSESGPAMTKAAAIAPSGLTLSASSLQLNSGGTTNLSGKLTFESTGGTKAASGKRVILEARQTGQTNFSEVRSTLTGEDGNFDFTGVKPTVGTDYRARFAGDSGVGMGSVTSSSVRVAVISKTALTLAASPATLNYGQTTRLSGKLYLNGKPISGKPVILEQRVVGASSFTAISGGQRTTASDGAFSLAGLKPTKNTAYRARFAGGGGLEAATSAVAVVSVKAKVSVDPPKVERPKKPKVSISGRVVTAKSGRVSVTIMRNGKVISRKKASIRSSRFSLSQRLPGKGRYTIKTSVPKSATHLGNRKIRRISF